ncbi:MAG: histidine kinase dimerization/phospho-acceptor domain-containing protein [Candidatus Acidiferrales bacterium]
MPDLGELTIDEMKSYEYTKDSATTLSEELEGARFNVERKLQDQAAEIEILREELKSLSYSVSHDLRAPIRHIQGFIGVVLEDFGNVVPIEMRQYLERIAEGAGDLQRLIEGLLEVAHIARQTMEVQSTDLGKLVREIIDGVVRKTPPDRQIEWNVQTLPQAECDPGMIKVRMEHLISNAFQFTRLEPGAVVNGAAGTNDGVCFFVTDNGIGFEICP